LAMPPGTASPLLAASMASRELGAGLMKNDNLSCRHPLTITVPNINNKGTLVSADNDITLNFNILSLNNLFVMLFISCFF